MSSAKWIAALALGSLPLSALAEPLSVSTRTTGQVTTLQNSFYELGGGVQPGAPLTVDFAVETNTSMATAVDGAWTTLPQSYFDSFGVTVGGTRLDLRSASYYDPQVLNQIQLRDNVRNAAGDLVDVFELSARAHTQYPNVTYSMTAHLEFGADTFDGLDAWSILAVDDAQLLGGTIYLNRVTEGWDGTFTSSSLVADVGGFDASFGGPGAEVPAVPEPGQYAMLLAGLAGAFVLRRRPGQAKLH